MVELDNEFIDAALYYLLSHMCLSAGVLVGLFVMGEPLPARFSLRLLRLMSWLVTIAGVSALANGKGQLQLVINQKLLLKPKNWILTAEALLLAVCN